MHLKKTMFVTDAGKYINRNGHAKNVSSVPAGTKRINYYVFDMSGQGRSGKSTIKFNDKITNAMLADAAKKA